MLFDFFCRQSEDIQCHPTGLLASNSAVTATTTFSTEILTLWRDSLDFTISDENFPGLAEYVKELKTTGIKFMTILGPCH